MGFTKELSKLNIKGDYAYITQSASFLPNCHFTVILC